jgi:GT2 family glycosyltransferase
MSGFIDPEGIRDAWRLCSADYEADAKTYAKEAKVLLDTDLQLVKLLQVRATPTFLLCMPDGRVLSADSLDQLIEYVELHKEEV